MSRQEQAGGDESENYQAGRDVIVYQGPSLEEFRQVALDVYRANFMELRGAAEEVALARADKVTNEFFDQLKAQNPDALKSAADPDMQRSLYNAQREYACSGEDDLGQVLVDLLVDRAGQDQRTIETVVLNEAITAAPKLTVDQRAALAVCFLVRYTRYSGPGTLEAYYDTIVEKGLRLLALGLPRKASAYQHIEYVGAGAVGMGSISVGQALASDRGFFTKGFTEDEVLEPLREFIGDSRVFVPCLRDAAKMQLNVSHEDNISDALEAIGRPDLEAPYKQQLMTGAMSPEEVESDVSARAPEVAELIEAWKNSSLPNLTLTTVGIAIGHAYWRRVTGQSAPLSIWL